ncbi:MAG TPA: DUF4390 domain-containing protein [Gemmatimonadales bacterium]|nr:DUF4390 domain-containing protein [Gemmatimonadales bacterium]
MGADRGRQRPLALVGMFFLLGLPSAALAQAPEKEPVRLEVTAEPSTHDPTVFTRNLLEDTPWLGTLRQGLPLRLLYRLEVWRSRDAWLDEQIRQVEWTVVVRHEPLLDQFTVTRLGPFRGPPATRRLGTAGALAEFLGVGLRYPVLTPKEPGRYYYRATLSVATLSDSDLDKFERALRGELDPRSDDGGGIAERARRLVLRLAGLPTANLADDSDQFEVR